jgi:hypothetical protein
MLCLAQASRNGMRARCWRRPALRQANKFLDELVSQGNVSARASGLIRGCKLT